MIDFKNLAFKNAAPQQVSTLALAMAAGLAVSHASAQSSVDTGFDTSDGFVTGALNPGTSLNSGDFAVTFDNGQQQQMFDGPSYNVGPAGFLFVNGGPGFTGGSGQNAASTGDQGTISFSQGATEVSFFGANRGQGAAVTVEALGLDGSVLGSQLITQTNIQAATNPTLTTFNANDLGGLIGSLRVDLPGPAANPPYVLAIDTFSATRASVFDDSVNGNASNNGAAPTAVDFSLGSNTIAGTVSNNAAVDNNRNFYTFTIDEGQELAAINVLDVSVTDAAGAPSTNPGFFALVEGSTAETPASGFDNLGGALFSPTLDFGTDLLSLISAGGISGGSGFEEIGPGEYTFVIQQTGTEISNFLVDFVVVPEPTSAALISLTGLALLRRRQQA